MKKKSTDNLSKTDFEQLLLEIETELVKVVPEAVRKAKIKTPSYAGGKEEIVQRQRLQRWQLELEQTSRER